MKSVIEFLGISRSGKTTQIDLLTNDLDDAGYSYNVVSRPSIDFEEIKTLEQWHKILYQDLCIAQEAYSRSPTDYLIYDRGFHDRLALLAADYADGHIGEAFYDELAKAIIPRLNHIDFVFAFMVSPELSLARWSRQGREGLDRSGLNAGLDTRDTLDGLEYLAAVYQTLKTEYAGSKWYEIDGSSPVEETYARIVNILRLELP